MFCCGKKNVTKRPGRKKGKRSHSEDVFENKKFALVCGGRAFAVVRTVPVPRNPCRRDVVWWAVRRRRTTSRGRPCREIGPWEAGFLSCSREDSREWWRFFRDIEDSFRRSSFFRLVVWSGDFIRSVPLFPLDEPPSLFLLGGGWAERWGLTVSTLDRWRWRSFVVFSKDLPGVISGLRPVVRDKTLMALSRFDDFCLARSAERRPEAGL